MRNITGKLTPELLKHTTPKTVGKDEGYKVSTVSDIQFLNINKRYF